jgi:hypothetical protein
MTGPVQPSIQTVADTIVARDVAQGRPGKDGETFVDPLPLPPPPPGGCGGCGCLLFCILVGLAIGGVAFVIGFFTAPTTGGTTSVTQPDFPVSVIAQKPDITTTPGNSTFNGNVQILFMPTCNGKTNQFTLPGQFQLGQGSFFLDPQGIPPWTGNVDSGNKVTATGQLGALTGTLVNGTNQPLTLNTPNFPCAGTYPVTLVLPSPITVTPSTTTGRPLAGVINSDTVFIGSTSMMGGGRHICWPLVAGGGVIDLAALGYLIAKFIFGDDDDYDDLYPRRFRRLREWRE